MSRGKNECKYLCEILDSNRINLIQVKKNVSEELIVVIKSMSGIRLKLTTEPRSMSVQFLSSSHPDYLAVLFVKFRIKFLQFSETQLNETLLLTDQNCHSHEFVQRSEIWCTSTKHCRITFLGQK